MRDRELETREELLNYLERVSGHSMRTRQDMDRFLEFMDEVHPVRANKRFAAGSWSVAKHIVLLLLAGFSIFQYLAVDTTTEILSFEKIKFLIPPPAPRPTRL